MNPSIGSGVNPLIAAELSPTTLPAALKVFQWAPLLGDGHGSVSVEAVDEEGRRILSLVDVKVTGYKHQLDLSNYYQDLIDHDEWADDPEGLWGRIVNEAREEVLRRLERERIELARREAECEEWPA